MSYFNYSHPNPKQAAHAQAGKLGCFAIFGLLLLTIVVTVGATVWVIQSQLFGKNFKPVELSSKEQLTLEQKLEALGSDPTTNTALTELQAGTDTGDGDDIAPDEIPPEDLPTDELQPEAYVEDDSKRRIELSERELNALLAKNTDLAEQFVVKLTDNSASLKLLLDLDPDLPFLGGKTLKVSGGIDPSYLNDRPVIVLRGVSVWGVPIPNAWLGGLKNIDLVSEFGGTEGFWKALADGIEDLKIENGKLLIQLAE